LVHRNKNYCNAQNAQIRTPTLRPAPRSFGA
jgi:hypothetical protein